MKSSRMMSGGALAMLSMPGAAMAHPGHEAVGFAAGLAHPFGGMDHLAAMLMVGLWAGLACKRRGWAVPAVFVGFMLAGFAWGLAGGPAALAEPLILASVLLLAAAIVCRILRLAPPPLPLAVSLVAVLAIGHGLAHGAEMPASANPAGFAAGFVLATIMLHLAGLGLATAVRRRRSASPAPAAAWWR